MSENWLPAEPEFPKPIDVSSPHRFATLYRDPQRGDTYYLDGLTEMTAAEAEEYGPWERVYTEKELLADGEGIFAKGARFHQRAKIAESRLLEFSVALDSLVDDEPCDWDHNHSCQAHGFHYIPQGEMCPNEFAKTILAEYKRSAS